MFFEISLMVILMNFTFHFFWSLDLLSYKNRNPQNQRICVSYVPETACFKPSTSLLLHIFCFLTATTKYHSCKIIFTKASSSCKSNTCRIITIHTVMCSCWPSTGKWTLVDQFTIVYFSDKITEWIGSITSNQVFYYTRCITPKSVTNLGATSPRHCFCEK